MSVPIPLRRDFTASQLRSLAKKTKDGPQARRLPDPSRSTTVRPAPRRPRSAASVCRLSGTGVYGFNARGPDGLLDRKRPGQPSKLNDGQREAIARMIESGPIPAVHGVVRWRLIDLAQWIFEEFRITVAKQTLSRELRAMGYPQTLGRPRHMRKPTARSRILKKLPTRLG